MIKLNRSKDKQYYFTVHSRNGQVLVTSETYKRRRNALNGMASLAKIIAGVAKVKNGEVVHFTDVSKPQA